MIGWLLFGLMATFWSVVSIIVLQKLLRPTIQHDEALKKIARDEYAKIIAWQKTRRVLVMVVLAGGWGLIVNVAIANYAQPSSAPSNASHLYILLDNSISMNTKDAAKGQSRLDEAKQALRRAVEKQWLSKVSLVTFHDQATVYPAVDSSEFVDELATVSTIPYFGTNGSDLGNALHVLQEQIDADKKMTPRDRYSVVIITDGEETTTGAYDSEASLAQLKSSHMSFKVVGVGSEGGGQIVYNPYTESYLNGGITGERKLSKNSSLQKPTLEHLAALGGGSYQHISQDNLLSDNVKTGMPLVHNIRATRYFYWLCALLLFISWSLYFCLPYLNRANYRSLRKPGQKDKEQ